MHTHTISTQFSAVWAVQTTALEKLNNQTTHGSSQESRSSGQDSAIHLHLKDKGDSFEEQNVHI